MDPDMPSGEDAPWNGCPLFQWLHSIRDGDEVRLKRRVIAAIAPRLQYSFPLTEATADRGESRAATPAAQAPRLHSHPDAFDVTVASLFKHVSMRIKEEGL